MARFASGVTVVTTCYKGEPIGITATSFASLSLDPPLVLINVGKSAFTHQVIADSGIFAVSVLGTDHYELGLRFAGMIPGVEDRFAGVETVTAVTGCPLLVDSMMAVDCRVSAQYDGGDHTIFVGEVVEVLVNEAEERPLLYYNRSWQRSEPLDHLRLPENVTMVEVGPRDGLQTLKKYVPVEQKINIINQLVAAGLKRIQVTSFVHPRLVPQMADAEEVCARLTEVEGVQYNGLVLNMRGLERAHKAGLKHVDMGVPASEALSQRNANSSIAEGMMRMADMVKQAREWGMSVRAGVQTAFGCVYEGAIPLQRVVELSKQFLAMGIDELSIADSSGMGNPQQVRRMMQTLRPLADDVPIVLHLHDTRGMGVANTLAALECGVQQFDSSFGGLGGCPFIEGAKGNIATEDTIFMMHEMGIHTGLDIGRLSQLSREMEHFLGQELPGKLYQLGLS